MLQPKAVLAPTDFSESARDALETAADVAARFHAALVVAYVVPALPKLPESVSIFKEGEYERALHEDALKRVTELSAKYAKAGVLVRTEVGVANDVPMEILRIAKRHEADLIVIATHGMTGWNEHFFGSVAEKVVRLSPGAVLVLKAPPAKR